MISILILTKDEEINIQECIESVNWSNDIVVLDSLSTDRTTFIAKKNKARIVERKFDNWASHQNWALRNINFKNKWVLYIDADERVSAELKDEIFNSINCVNDGTVAFNIYRRDYWGKTWLKHVQATSLYTRLFIPQYISYKRLVNPITMVNGKTKRLKGHLRHYTFAKGISHWFDKHNSYSTFEAIQDREDKKEKIVNTYKSYFNYIDIKFTLKKIFLRLPLPLRPFVRFFYLYFFSLGFLDGKAGLKYAILQFIYEFMIILKIYEKEN